jgi:hypothetical protein
MIAAESMPAQTESTQIRRERILASESLDAPIQLLEVISRCQGIGDTLEECASLIKSLSIHRYWGDYAL